MIDFNSYRKDLHDFQNELKNAQKIPDQIRNISRKIQDKQSQNLVFDLGDAFLSDIKSGKIKDLETIINRAENIANGNESTGN